MFTKLITNRVSAIRLHSSVVVKDWLLEDKDKDKDLGSEDEDKDKDLGSEDEDEDSNFKYWSSDLLNNDIKISWSNYGKSWPV